MNGKFDPNQVRFTQPVTGRVYYVVRGNTGVGDMVDRKSADRELLKALGDVHLRVAVEGLASQMPPPPKKMAWEQVRDYLGDLLSVDGDLIHVNAVISLWAQAVAEYQQRRGN